LQDVSYTPGDTPENFTHLTSIDLSNLPEQVAAEDVRLAQVRTAVIEFKVREEMHRNRRRGDMRLGGWRG
jgi:hypothetical protein